MESARIGGASASRQRVREWRGVKDARDEGNGRMGQQKTVEASVDLPRS